MTSALMPSKAAITSLHQHFDKQFVNEAIRKYTSLLLQGKESTFDLLLLMPPPPMFEVWEPDPTGRPRRWNKPWKLTQSSPGTDHPGKGSQAGLPAEDSILSMASSTEHPTMSKPHVANDDQSTLLGYFWNLREDTVSTNKSSVINLMPARRGIRPS